MSKPLKQRYRTTNWATYNRSLKQRGSVLVWIDPAMQWEARATGKPGRPTFFTDAAIQFCLTLKVLHQLPLRQATGFVESLLQQAGLNWRTPDYSTLCRREKTLQVELGRMPRSGPLHLLIDSTGVKMLGEGEWKRKKHGADYRRQWRKVHLGIDAETLEIRAMEVTDNGTGDAPMLPELLRQIPAEEVIDRVSADGAYDTRSGHAAIAARQAVAVIPVRKNGQLWKGTSAGVLARNETLRATQRLGRRVWKQWSGYHRRSLVETKMRCFKLLGERVAARDFDRQVAELQIRASILNRFTRIGRPHTVVAA